MIYAVQTSRFGSILVDADSIREARLMARRFGVRHPRSTSRFVAYRLCERCDSKPCTCAPREERS